LGKNLGTDGWAYGEKDNGTLVDVTPTAGAPMYNFPWPNASAYALSIQANGIDISPSIFPSTFCVGQRVDFNPVWSGGYGPPNVMDIVAHWDLPGTFVNTNPYPSCPDYYIENPSFLNLILSRDHTVDTGGWFVNGSGGQCCLSLMLYFSNGQTAFMQANGFFIVYRPTIDHWNLFPYGNPKVMAAGGYLAAGTLADNSNGMSFWPYVISTSFLGEAGFTQIITGVFSGLRSAAPTNELDGAEWVRGQQTIYSYPSPVYFDDEPRVPLPIIADTATMNLSFVDYLRFRPDAGNPADNIFVTLELVTWGVKSSATYTSETGWQVDEGSSITRPQYTGSDAFPLYTNTFNP
jgi:hypothetical protein